jgi:hypothetical protein
MAFGKKALSYASFGWTLVSAAAWVAANQWNGRTANRAAASEAMDLEGGLAHRSGPDATGPSQGDESIARTATPRTHEPAIQPDHVETQSVARPVHEVGTVTTAEAATQTDPDLAPPRQAEARDVPPRAPSPSPYTVDDPRRLRAATSRPEELAQSLSRSSSRASGRG